MASENLQIDANGRWVLGGVTNDGNEEIRNARVNPITGALIVEANVTSSNTSIGSTIPGATQGSIFFAGLGGTLAQDNANFFWDDTNNYLGIGTNTPAENLHVVGTAIITGDVGTADQLLGRDSGTGEITGITVGSGLSLVGNTLSATGGGGSGYDLIQNQGVSVTQRTTINLSNLLTASDSGGKTAFTINTLNLANDTNFIDDLIANSYFTTSLANDSTFISTLTGNATFISDIVSIVNSSGSVAINLSTQVTGTLGVGNGGTGATTLTGVLVGNGSSAITGTAIAQGDLFYGSTSGVLSALAKNTSATRYLSNTGTNNNPAWAQINLSNGVTGTLPVTNGGTGASSLTAYAVLCGGTTSTGAVQSVASVGTAGQVLTSNGAGALPTFQTATSSTSYANGIDSKSGSSQTITHNLGITPKRVITHAVNSVSNTSGFYDSSGQNSVGMRQGGGAVSSNSAAFLVNDNAVTTETGVISNLTTTTFDITWSGTSFSATLLWAVEG